MISAKKHKLLQNARGEYKKIIYASNKNINKDTNKNKNKKAVYINFK